LAQGLRLGVLPAGAIDPKAARAVRDVWRTRAPLVRQHTAHGLSGHNILARHTGSRFSAQRIHACPQADLEGLRPEAHQGLAVTSRLARLDWLRQQRNTRAKAVTTSLQPTPGAAQLSPVDGIGTILAQTIGRETGDMGRVLTVGNSAADCRWVKSTKISNGKRQGPGNVNTGHPYLEWASMAAAPCAMRFNPTGPRFSQRQHAKSHLRVARQAVAHTLSRACYDSMRDLVPCDVHTAFG